VLRRRDPVEACRNVVRWLKVARGRVEADPYNCFDELMTLSERHGLRSRFYMIAGDSAGALDANYGIGDPCIRALMRRIHSRGHELGLHGSYASAADPERLRAEADRLRGVCREEGIVQPRWGGRQHFLRWEPRRGASAWRAAGLEYDSSLGYTDDPGFRCGTCYQYPLFDLAERRRSGVSELPLVLMERAVAPFPAALSERELESAVTRVRTLRERCRLFDGDFVFLLHNSKYKAARHRRLYESMLGAA
jgi:peptidoglycan/xylan/chitin deacetylase (PgdA/CDA1 family)